MPSDKKVIMKLSQRAYKELKGAMKKFGFADEDLFIKYCVLKTIKQKYPANDKRLIAKEIKEILAVKKVK